MLFKKKVPAVDPRIEERDELYHRIARARTVLRSRVESALAHNLMLTVLPADSTEYQATESELKKTKQDVIEWMHSYQCCIDDIKEFAASNPDINANGDNFCSPQQFVLSICKDSFKR